MKKVAIFMSDFHLGQKDQMEEFHADEEFAELLGRLSQKHGGDVVDLVLVGDVIDLWTTTMDPAEVNAKSAKDVKLYVPVLDLDDKDKFDKALENEKQKVKAITKAHPRFFEALGRFLVSEPHRRRIVYIPGNHDHSMVHQDLQKIIRQEILKGGGLVGAGFDERVAFRNWYGDEGDEKCLQVYAEHGNQFTYGGIFRYQDGKGDSTFNIFGTECPGYVQFKLVSNRLERRSPELDSVFMEFLEPAMWPGVLWWLLIRGNFKALKTARRFKLQYELDDRPEVRWARTVLPPAWRIFLNLTWNRYFGLTRDEFSKAVLYLFDCGSDVMPLSGKRLDAQTVKTVVMGHTHQAREVELPGLEGVKYYNTGGWLLRYENGRRVIEQTWLTITAELEANDQYSTTRKVIDREMIRRNVELPHRNLSPVTTEGKSLNAVMREMPDLRVGDVMLFHWNFGATMWRLIKSGRILKAASEVPHMVMSWFNRYGTFSYWSHIALVYGSPSEKEEASSYNDPVLLEAEPDTGVAIHGPQQYLAHRRDWDIAVLRPTAKWFEDWNNRRLLRRLALSRLQMHYDNTAVFRITMLYAGRAVESQGRPSVGGIIKGALAAVVINTIGLALLGLLYLVDNGQRLLAQTTQSIPGGGRQLIESDSGPIPRIVFDLLDSGDLSFQILKWGLIGISIFIMIVSLGHGLWKASRTWVVVNGIWGAAWGALIIPIMAELADGWKNLPNLTRWLIFMLVPTTVIVVGSVLGLAYKADKQEALALCVMRSTPELVSDDLKKQIEVQCQQAVQKEEREKRTNIKLMEVSGIGALLLAATILGLLLPSMKLLGSVASRCHAWITQWARRRQVAVLKSPVIKEKQFICSTLVYDAFLQVADQLAQNGQATIQLHRDTDWRLTLPRHFAESDKFKWKYLLFDGVVIPEPNKIQGAQVSGDALSEEAQGLVRETAWSFRLALLGLCMIVLADVAKSYNPSKSFLAVSPDSWAWILLGAGLLCEIASLWLAGQGRRRLAREPARRGGVLLFWSVFLAATSLFGAAFIGHAMIAGAHFHLMSLWWALLLVGLIAGMLF